MSIGCNCSSASTHFFLQSEVNIDAQHEARNEAEEAGGHAVEQGAHPRGIGGANYIEASRAARLDQLKAVVGAPPVGPYGEVHAVVDASDFLDRINTAGPGTFVVVHMFEDFVPECQAINAVLPATAVAASHVLFMRVLASTLKRNFDPVALPSFMVYRNGDTFATEVAVADDMIDGHGGISPAAIADCLMLMGVPAALLTAAVRLGPPQASPGLNAIDKGPGTHISEHADDRVVSQGQGVRSPIGTVRRSSLRPNSAVGAFSGAGSSIHGRLQTAAEAGLDEMD
jgi:hypothetical protein